MIHTGEMHGVPWSTAPHHAGKLYFRVMFSTTFWGPFDTIDSVIAAIRRLDFNGPDWDARGPFAVFYGADPLPSDWVNGFTPVPDADMRRIIQSREAP